MRYYQCNKYSIEFVLSENIDKHFASHNHVGHYVISVVMQGMVKISLENRESECHRGDMLRDAVEQGIFGREQREKLLLFLFQHFLS